MIFVTGDCHGNFERFKPEYFPEQAQMTKRDIVICAGDFGGVWFGDGRDEAALDWLESLPFTLAFVESCRSAGVSYHERGSLSTFDQSGQKQDGYPLDKWSQNGYIMYQSSEHLPPWGSNSTSQPAE